jgi:hypothetical protein
MAYTEMQTHSFYIWYWYKLLDRSRVLAGEMVLLGLGAALDSSARESHSTAQRIAKFLTRPSRWEHVRTIQFCPLPMPGDLSG